VLDGVLRRSVAGVSGVVAALALAWTAWLALFGGIDTRIFGRAVTSNDPLRTLLIAALALAIHMLAGGDAAVTRRTRGAARALDRVSRHPRVPFAAAAALALAVFGAALVDGSKTADGADSYGYVSEAGLFLQGQLKVAQPWMRDVPWPDADWTFSPLGYKPAPAVRPPGPGAVGALDRTFRRVVGSLGFRPIDVPSAIVPTYSPGFPLLMAAACRIAGTAGMFWIVPLSAFAYVLSTYGIGRRIGSARLGALAAFFVVTSPPVLVSALTTMSDLPVSAAWTVAIWALLGDDLRSAGIAAVAMGSAVVIRPNLVPLVPVAAMWLAVRVARAAGARRRRHLVRAAIVLAGAALGVIVTATIYWMTYGSPFESGYGPTSDSFATAYFWPNLANYTQWLAANQTPLVFLGIAAIAWPAARLWPRAVDRSAVAMSAIFTAVVALEFCFYLVGDNDGYLRFLLPAYPYMMIGLAAVCAWIGRRSRVLRLATLAAAVVYGGAGVEAAARRGVFQQWHDAKAIELAQITARLTPERSVILAMQHSGSIRYYGGRVTLRWDLLAGDWLDRAVSWMSARGVPTYAVLDTWERDRMRAAFAGQAIARRLDDPPLVRLEERALYDLSSPEAPVRTDVVPFAFPRGRGADPAPMPAFTWGPPAARAASSAGVPGAPSRRVLFIGNSLTAANDLPGLVDALARAAPDGPVFASQAVVIPDFSLEDQWARGDALRAIRRGGWSDVVLQQGPSSLPESQALLRDYTKRFDAEIRKVGARTALYMVWPAASRPQDFDGVSASYAAAARDVHGLLLNVGDAWRAAWTRDASLGFYGPDGFHPTPLGSYAAALVIYRGLSGRSPVGLPATVRLASGAVVTVPPAAAQLLQEVVAVIVPVRPAES